MIPETSLIDNPEDYLSQRILSDINSIAMAHHAVRFEYPHAEIPIILRSSYQEDRYYGVDVFERKRIKIILAKFGCRHSFHTLPGKVTASLHPFEWDRLGQCFRIRMEKKVEVQLNTLEEMVVNHPVFEEE